MKNRRRFSEAKDADKYEACEAERGYARTSRETKARQRLNIRLLVLLTTLDCICSYPALSQIDVGKVNSGQSSSVSNENNPGSDAIADTVPSPPAIVLPEPAQSISGSPAVSLAWRSRALALANEYPLKKNSLVWTLPVNYGKGQNLLKQAINELGLQLLSQYIEAGQFLISVPEANNKSEIIVISQPIGETTTLFRMRVYTNGRTVDNKKANSLPETMKNLLTNQGLWQ